MFSDPSSTYYTRPDIDYQQLTQNNNRLCTLGTDMILPPETVSYPTARSKGDGLIYLTGYAITSAQINGGDTILTVPSIYNPFIEGNFLLPAIVLGPQVSEVYAFILQTTGELVLGGGSVIDNNTAVYFNPLFYIQNFVK